jgi:putative NADPH-quinone reductase
MTDGGQIVKMQISVILAHPDPASFNHAIAQTVIAAIKANGHRVFFHDLYQEKFDPLLTREEIAKDAPLLTAIKKHCAEIAAADGVVIIHPNWWGQPPAILKGWVDRVIRPGVAYEFLEGDAGEGIPKGLLKAKVALVFNTSNTETKREKDVFGDPLETIWKNCIFGLCGITNFHRRIFNVVVTSSEAQRRRWLNEVKKDINIFFLN